MLPLDSDCVSILTVLFKESNVSMGSTNNRFVMYFFHQGRDIFVMKRYVKNFTKRRICHFRCVPTSPKTVFYQLRFCIYSANGQIMQAG